VTAGSAPDLDATRPPFPVQVRLPDDPSWLHLDTRPMSWVRSARRAVDDRLAEHHPTPAERRELLGHIGDVVVAAQQAEAVVSMVQIARRADGGVNVAGLHITWYESSPELASLATVRLALPRSGTVEQHRTATGRLLLHRDAQWTTPPGRSDRVRLTSLQAFLPLPARCWTAVVATACAHADQVDTLHDLVLDVAGSIAEPEEPT